MTNTLTQAQKALAAAAPGQTVTLLQSPTPRAGGICAGAVVLRHIPTSPQPYVTHWRNDDLGGYHKGGYHDTLAEAVEDYEERVRKGR